MGKWHVRARVNHHNQQWHIIVHVWPKLLNSFKRGKNARKCVNWKKCPFKWIQKFRPYMHYNMSHLSIDNPQSAMNWYEMDPIFRTWSWSRANAELRIVHSRLGCWSGRRQHGWQTSAQQHESHAGRSGWWGSLLLAVATLKHLCAFYNRHNYWQVCRVDGRFDDWLRVCQKCFILPATILCTLLDCKT